jgi:imidazolonepropionase-like amidohydrolase
MKQLSDNVIWRQHGKAPEDWGRLIRYAGTLVFAVAAIFYLQNAITNVFQWQSHFNRLEDQSISLSELEYGRYRCLQDQQRPMVDYGLASKRLASLSKDTISNRVILKNTTIIDGDGKTSSNMTIVLRGSIIEQIHSSNEFIDDLADGGVIMDAAGRYVSPGLIEMHSHVGVRSLPQLWASEDVTETSAPVTSWARAIDGYKSNDLAIDLIASGGVTTSLVLTGAQNIISGEGYVFKMKRNDSPYSMLVNTSHDTNGKPQRYLKAALGENVKKTFQHRLGGPVTREGVSYHLRHALEAAKHLKQQQDVWCDSTKTKNSHNRLVHDPYPESLELQTLVDLLRGDIRLNVHCYETEDLYSLFDHSDEFGFNVSAVHHALASHLMIDELKSRQVAVATFADEWGFKPELYDTSFYLPKYLVDAGIPLVLTTDHPAGYGKLLTYQAQVAYHYGVDADHAIASLTGVPAKALGLDNRIGYIRPGFDADLVVWNKHPLQLGATPLLVSINGDVVINATESLWTGIHPSSDQSKGPPPQRTQKQNDPSACSPGQNDLVVQGITSDFFNDNNPDMEDKQHTNGTGTAVIRNGELVCVGKHHCRTLAQSLVRENHVPVLNVTDGYVLPVR